MASQAFLRAEKSKIPLHGPEDFPKMRAAGALAAAVLDFIEPFVQEGVTTEKLDELCHKFIVDHQAIPACLHYNGFPKSTCISLNHVVCHGIPGPRTLIKGDILNIDVTVIVEGWHGDTSRMFTVGKPSSIAAKLIRVTQEALLGSIELVRPGIHFGDLGAFIQAKVEAAGFSVVRDYCGHGIGRVFHDEPQIPHFGKPGHGPILEEGMFFTIEPMVNVGKPETKLLKDLWTAVTADHSLSAQFEHSLGVTAHGVEIFTQAAP
jgi:methionyl aminopeptidase